MVIQMDWSLANDYPDWLASCKWSSVWASLMQMITWRDRPLANDHADQLDSSPFFYSSTYFLSSTSVVFPFKTFRLFLQILGSRFNLANLFRKICTNTKHSLSEYIVTNFYFCMHRSYSKRERRFISNSLACKYSSFENRPHKEVYLSTRRDLIGAYSKRQNHLQYH